jgi:hypothetical protein
MSSTKKYIYGTLLSLPFIGLWFYLLHPPQCPINYTQEQIDASRCIVGANIGGTPIFFVAAIATWFVAVWLVKKLVSKKDSA